MQASPASQSIQSDAEAPHPRRQPSTTLVSRNIVVGKHRTSVRLEPDMWAALKDISRRERASLHEICSTISKNKPDGTSLTAAIRVFIMAYFRNTSTEDGHMRAGHGQGMLLSGVSLTLGSAIPPRAPALQPAPGYMIGSRITPTTPVFRSHAS